MHSKNKQYDQIIYDHTTWLTYNTLIGTSTVITIFILSLHTHTSSTPFHTHTHTSTQPPPPSLPPPPHFMSNFSLFLLLMFQLTVWWALPLSSTFLILGVSALYLCTWKHYAFPLLNKTCLKGLSFSNPFHPRGGRGKKNTHNNNEVKNNQWFCFKVLPWFYM